MLCPPKMAIKTRRKRLQRQRKRSQTKEICWETGKIMTTENQEEEIRQIVLVSADSEFVKTVDPAAYEATGFQLSQLRGLLNVVFAAKKHLLEG